MEEMPAVFEPYYLRGGVSYKNLSKHRFRSEEIDWICRHFPRHQERARMTRSLRAFCSRYHLNSEQVLFWINTNDWTANSGFLSQLRSEDDLVLDMDSIAVLTNAVNSDSNDIEELAQVFWEQSGKTSERRSRRSDAQAALK
jgi:hypothetical protein